MTDDNDRIGLTRSTQEGQSVALASALSGQTGWRRTAAKVLAFGGLAVIFGAVVAGVVNLFN